MTDIPLPKSGVRPTRSQSKIAAKHNESIGYIVSQWATLELTIDVSALQLAGIESDAGLCFTAQIAGATRKLDAYQAAARLQGVTRLIREINDFGKSAARLAERRNRVVHDPWFTWSLGVPTRLEVTARKVLRKALVPFPPQDMETLTNDLAALMVRFADLHDRVMAEAGRDDPRPLPAGFSETS